MNRALLGKELRSLFPFLWGVLGLLAVSTIYLLASEPVDAHPFTPERWLTESRSSTFVVIALFSLIVGAGLLMQERNNGTLLFLEGLPVSRSRIFWMKVAAALLILSAVVLFGGVSDIAFGELARNSLSGPRPWKFLALITGLQLLATALLLALALVVSFTRAWFALVTGLLFWGYILLRQRGADWLAYFDPHELLGTYLAAGRLRIPWRHIAAHAGGTVFLLGVAWLGFLALGDRVQLAADRLTRRGCVIAALAWLRWLAPVVWIGGFVSLAKFSGVKPPREDHRPAGESAFRRTETERYEFLYRTSQEKAAGPLIALADEIYNEVLAFLHATPAPARVVVDLASPVMSHAAGQTNWTKIRMPLRPDQSPEDLRVILAHETTHVFIEQLGGGKLDTHFNEIRCLHEGLATHVEHVLFSDAEQVAESRREAAGAWSRGAVSFESLIDNKALSKVREPNLAYPLGAVLARVLIETHGTEAPAKLLRALGRRQAPTGLKGAALWRDAMQAAGLSVDRLAAAYDAACNQLVIDEKAFVDSLPRLSATVEVVGDRIVVRPKFEGTAPGRIACFTTIEDVLLEQIEELDVDADGTFSWPRERVSRGTFRYLLGWRTPQTRLPIFEPWNESKL